MTFTLECCIALSGQQFRAPGNGVSRRVFVEVARHTGKLELRPFPLWIVEHSVEMAMSGVPAAVISLCHTLRINSRPCNQIGKIQPAFAAATDAHQELVILHRADAAFHAL